VRVTASKSRETPFRRALGRCGIALVIAFSVAAKAPSTM
jgi:hypothetical protein